MRVARNSDHAHVDIPPHPKRPHLDKHPAQPLRTVLARPARPAAIATPPTALTERERHPNAEVAVAILRAVRLAMLAVRGPLALAAHADAAGVRVRLSVDSNAVVVEREWLAAPGAWDGVDGHGFPRDR